MDWEVLDDPFGGAILYEDLDMMARTKKTRLDIADEENREDHGLPEAEYIEVEEVLDVSEVLAAEENEREMHLITPSNKRYGMMMSVSSKDDGVDDSLLEAAPSALATTYSVAQPSYSTADFATIDGYQLGAQLPGTTYIYDNTYQYYQQYQPSIPSPAATYLLHPSHPPATSPSSVDENAPTSSSSAANSAQHAARASPATIHWLQANYEKAEGQSLPRCTLYEHYKKHCKENSIDAVNAASFGKLIRSIFNGLQTRRLGTRGNSKLVGEEMMKEFRYHYYGIKVRESSSLMHEMSPDFECSRNGQVTRSSSRRATACSSSSSHRGSASSPRPGSFSSPRNGSEQPTGNASLHSQHLQEQMNEEMAIGDSALASENEQNFLGVGEVPRYGVRLDETNKILMRELQLDIPFVTQFVDSYNVNCQDILICIKQLNFDGVEECWVTFWQPEEADEDGRMESEGRLTQSQLFSICTFPQVQKFMELMDFEFYQVVADVLVPDLLSSKIQLKDSLNTRIRNFARSVESSLRKALQGAPDSVVDRKLAAVRMLAYTLRRYTSLAHLSNAARVVFNNEDTTKMMADDFNRVDMVSVQEQADWVTRCDPLFVRQISESFKENLMKGKKLDDWAEWMEGVIDQVLAKYHDRRILEIASASKRFLLNWNFYSSMVIRDLTLRSCHSFGHFHLIRLLFDEYLMHLVELRLARTARRPLLSVMAAINEEELETDYSCVVAEDPVYDEITFDGHPYETAEMEVPEGVVERVSVPLEAETVIAPTGL